MGSRKSTPSGPSLPVQIKQMQREAGGDVEDDCNKYFLFIVICSTPVRWTGIKASVGITLQLIAGGGWRVVGGGWWVVISIGDYIISVGDNSALVEL